MKRLYKRCREPWTYCDAWEEQNWLHSHPISAESPSTNKQIGFSISFRTLQWLPTICRKRWLQSRMPAHTALKEQPRICQSKQGTSPGWSKLSRCDSFLATKHLYCSQSHFAPFDRIALSRVHLDDSIQDELFATISDPTLGDLIFHSI